MSAIVRRLVRWRWWAVGAVAVAVIAYAAVGFGGSDAPVRDATPRWTSAAVQRGTVQVAEQADGTVGYGAGAPLQYQNAGTVTWLPKQGQVVRLGGQLVRVDDRPVSLMFGAVPMYRDIGLVRRTTVTRVPAARPGKASNAPSEVTSTSVLPLTGTDVEQLEHSLRLLGYHGFDVDRTFTSATEDAVRRWQRAVGVPATGRVARGSVAFLSGAVRVSQVDGRVGGDATAGTVSVSSLREFVTVQVAAGDSVWTVGATVNLVVGDGRRLTGRIVRTGGGDGGDGTGGRSTPVLIEAKPGGPDLGRAGTAVTATRIVREHRNVLSVPVTALVAFAGGGFGVQLAAAPNRYVAVRPGLYSGGRVEVAGTGLRAGQLVRVPR